VHAALGPSIDSCCYAVDGSIADALEQRWGTQSGGVSRDRGAKPTVDLRRINTAILEGAGVHRAQIVHVGPCTRCAAAEYFSHRAANGPTGRQWSFIGWQA
jgi:copper oxidase (laccase) domain-containing protein